MDNYLPSPQNPRYGDDEELRTLREENSIVCIKCTELTETKGSQVVKITGITPGRLFSGFTTYFFPHVEVPRG